MTAPELVRHAFVRRPAERAGELKSVLCDLCALPERDVVHERAADPTFTSDNDVDPVSGLPYHEFLPGAGMGYGISDIPKCRICGFDSSAMVHNQPPPVPAESESVGSMIDSSMIASEDAEKVRAAVTKKGKHHYIHPRDITHSTTWMGGSAPCVACGKPPTDPEHDVSTDTTGTPQTSVDAGIGVDVSQFQHALTSQLVVINGDPAWIERQQAAGNGTMVALFPKSGDARKIALDGKDAEDPKDLHVTMAYLPDFPVEHLPLLHHAVARFAAATPPIEGRVSGKGHFNPTEGSDDKPVTYASVDSPGLEDHRRRLMSHLGGQGLRPAEDHGFTPHMTLAYSKRNDEVASRPITFDQISVANGADRKHFHLAGIPDDFPGWADKFPGKSEAEPASERGFLQLTERSPQFTRPASAPAERAFFTEVNGKTLLTAPAYTVPSSFEIAQSPSNFMKYMAGRFVGGEKANRNGAFWSVGDLEFGLPTVAHGPLNWLHEARHIIGTITAANLVKPTAEQADMVGPHIEAMAGMWAWVYPDEVAVVEQASDASKLWYSMECVSNTVACVGEGSCGTEVGYLDYIKNGTGTCQHMRQRAGADRRFVEPTFLGAAVILPPVRPGWADAHASVMRQASAHAEKAFEQARPDMTASDWELLMAQILTYAGVQ